MTIPTLPTDNLYKFRALAGVAIALLSTYFLITSAARSWDQLMELRQAADLMDIQLDVVRSKVKRLDKLIENSLAESKGTLKTSPDQFMIRYSDEEIKSMFREADDLIDEQLVTSAKVRHFSERSMAELTKLILIAISYLFVAMFGLLQARSGFKYWYERVQEPQDRLLKKQIEKLSL